MGIYVKHWDHNSISRVLELLQNEKKIIIKHEDKNFKLKDITNHPCTDEIIFEVEETKEMKNG